MDRIYKPVFFIFFFLITLVVFSQDSQFKWTVTSKKIADGKYELNFSTNGVAGWQLYSAQQTIPELVSELKFGDSAIKQENGFVKGEYPKKTGVIYLKIPKEKFN